MEEDKISKSFTEYNQTKVAQLKRVQELSVKVEDKWHTEATEVSLSEKDEILHAYTSHDRKANYSELKNKKMMVFKIELPTEYLVTSIKFNFNSIDALKLIYNIEAYSELTSTKQSFIRPLESQKIVTVDPMLKFLIINLYSFASILYIYYQPVTGSSDSDGRVNKKNKNVFSYNGPLHDLNAEIQKSNIKANDLDELDNEVAMISRKSPKNQTTQNKDENDKSKQQDDNDEYNTRNFNSIPRNYDDKSDNSKSEGQIEESKQKPGSGVASADNQTDESSPKVSMITSITISGAKGLQSKINLIPLFNIKSLFQRAGRYQEVVEIEYMCALSLICTRRYVQALESLKKVQAQILKRLHHARSQEGSGSLNQQDLLSGNTIPEPKDSKNYKDMMKAAELEILIAE